MLENLISSVYPHYKGVEDNTIIFRNRNKVAPLDASCPWTCPTCVPGMVAPFPRETIGQ